MWESIPNMARPVGLGESTRAQMLQDTRVIPLDTNARRYMWMEDLQL
jgi:hypothetical protein